MIRLLVREAFFTAVLVWLVSVLAFVALDATGRHDWYGTLPYAERAGVSTDRALARDLPRLWNARVADARVRTEDDLVALRSGSQRDSARIRIVRRGAAAIPTLLAQLRSLRGETQREALDLLARLAPGVTGGDVPPNDTEGALAWWERFDSLHRVEFRDTYARRLVLRLVDRDSRNAAEQLARLGTFALPAIMTVLDEPLDVGAARAVTTLLSNITGRPLRIPDAAAIEQVYETVAAWRAWWFAERLEFTHLNGTDHALAHIGETRYGRWLTRLFEGRSAASRWTGRPVLLELRERIPASVFVAGLGGLLAVAFMVAFGGGEALRKRALNVKLLDLAGALIPGLVAFGFGFIVVVQIAAAPQPAARILMVAFRDIPAMVLAVLGMGGLAVLWLRRRFARVTLHAVRLEAETWARESRHPKLRQIARHGLRVGLSSVLAPMGLAAAMMVIFSMIVEPVAGLRGMGSLTVQAFVRFDAAWLILSAMSAVPVLMGERWARLVLIWALGSDNEELRASLMPSAPAAPAPRPVEPGDNRSNEVTAP